MKYQRLGNSGLRVSALGLGTKTWGATTTAEQATAILHEFVEQGGTLIDIDANNQPALEILSEVLSAPLRERVVISLTLGVRPNAPLGRRVDASCMNIHRELKRTLRILQLDAVDIATIGHWDAFTPSQEVASTIEQLSREGLIRYASVRGYSGWQLAVTTGAQQSFCQEIIAAQAPYNLLQRQAEHELFAAAEYVGAGIIAGAPLAHGVLSGKYREQLPPSLAANNPNLAEVHQLAQARPAVVEALYTAAKGLEIPMSVAALAWVRQRSNIAATLCTPRTTEQLSEMLQSIDVLIPRSILKALDDVSIEHW